MDVHYLHFDTLPSTNTWVKEHAWELDLQAITCLSTDIQTAGRGRMKRTWISKKGNLHMTLFLPIKLTDPRLPNLSQLLAFAAAQVMLSYQIPVQIKWPNDLIVEGKKLSGILVETCDQGAILGIGVNVNARVDADQPATFMKEILKREVNLQEVRKKIVSYFLNALEMPFHTLVPYFNQLLAFKNEKVRCSSDGKQTEGILKGINERGQLELQIGDDILLLSSGDIQQLRLL